MADQSNVGTRGAVRRSLDAGCPMSVGALVNFLNQFPADAEVVIVGKIEDEPEPPVELRAWCYEVSPTVKHLPRAIFTGTKNGLVLISPERAGLVELLVYGVEDLEAGKPTDTPAQGD